MTTDNPNLSVNFETIVYELGRRDMEILALKTRIAQLEALVAELEKDH